jgi:hypothetical protein
MEPQDLQRDLGRVEGKLDGVVAAITSLSTRLDARDTSVDKEFDRVHKRVSSVEKKIYYYTGVFAVVVWITTSVIPWHSLLGVAQATN